MTLKNWAVPFIPALPPNSRDLQEKESSANRCWMLRKSVESNGRSISRGAAPRRAKKLDQETNAAVAAGLEFPGSWSGRSATRTVLAHGFVDQRIEFAARQRHIIARVFSAVTGEGQFRSAARRGRDKVTRTSRHQLGDFPAGEQPRPTGHFRSQGDLRAVLDGLHSKER